ARGRCSSGCAHGEVDLAAELKEDALRCLLPDAWDFCQPHSVFLPDDLGELVGGKYGEHSDGEAGTDAGDIDEAAEGEPFEGAREPEELKGVLAERCVHRQDDLP